ncbi:MAG: DHHW family protein, partial [Ethanoligenens sp.]
ILRPISYFSENEKRQLQTAPTFSWTSLEDGFFASGVESYLSDHFPARLQLVGLNAYSTLFSGQNGANGVYAGKDGYLINKPISVDTVNFEQNLSAIRSFAKQQNLSAYLMVVPTTGDIEPDKLPAVHAPYPDDSLLEQARKAVSTDVSWVDLKDAFSKSETKSNLFYRTDHHWTSAGAYLAYCTFCAQKGFSPLAVSQFTKQNISGFYGTTYSKSGLWGVTPDTLSVWINSALHVSMAIQDDGTSAAIHSDSMFFWNQLGHKDKYPIFLDGNHSLVTIENSSAPDRGLLIVKDSYADSLAPFLASHYRRIDLVDLRYFHQNSVSSLIKKDRLDEVLFVYGVDSLVNDRNISMLD